MAILTQPPSMTITWGGVSGWEVKSGRGGKNTQTCAKAGFRDSRQ